ncbi:MAG: cytochrome-c peroxidase [Bacteroidetes bacterium]|nr:cytochrome-c peroxidase [Bacteroidota bacterium]
MDINASVAKRWALLALLGVTLLSQGCQKGEEPVDPYAFNYPDYFPDPTYTFDNNPITEQGFKLGKKLFFDPILSRDGTIACSNCHVQAVAFADAAHPISIGIEERIGKRNAPGLFNLGFRETFIWDGGVTHLDFVPLNAIENPLEMDDDISLVIQKLTAHPEYPTLFRQAFGTDTINGAYFLHAMAQFQLLLISAGSEYDQMLQGEKSLTPLAKTGLSIFESRCATCHDGALFTDQSFRNNGLNASHESDPGRALITAANSDKGTFKVPSLRNVAATSPYMHDARFGTLEEVLDHYDVGMVDSETLDPVFRQPDGSLGIPLTDAEKKALIVFLETLTDRDFLRNPLFFRN